jgi:4-hydroxy-3-polyprenylbenzoate decarboxylase
MVAVVGRTNAGKSTLVNRIIGENISIVTPVAQTTRSNIRGILTDPRGQLVLIPRETPVSLIQLRNMVAVTEAGGVVLPASPGLYTMPETVQDMVDFVVGKALDVLRIEHALFPRWGQPNVATAAPGDGA